MSARIAERSGVQDIPAADSEGSVLRLLSGHKPDSPEREAGSGEGPDQNEKKLCCHFGGRR